MHDRTRSRPWLSICLLLALSCNPAAALAQAERNPAHQVRLPEAAAAARVIVKFKPDAALLRKHALSATAGANETRAALTLRADSLALRLGLSLRAGRALSEHAQVVTASRISSAALAELLNKENDVEYAVVDQRRTHFATPNDPLYMQGPGILGSMGGPAVGQWYLHAPTASVAASINAAGAWDLTTGSPSIVVAVLDSGVRPEHPDLANRLLPGYNMISDIATANDGDARDADASDPGDWVTQVESSDQLGQFYQCDVTDSSWHGTMTTSLIGAASNNGIGMAGVAWGVKLLPVRVLGKCGGLDSDIIAGMRWAAGLAVPGVPANPTPARVINMSLGSAGACPLIYIEAINAITSKKNPAVIVAAAGNSSGLAVGVPANCPGVIGVAGLRHIGSKVGFSDLGPEITISAPGGNCVNTDAAAPCLYPILAATNTGTTRPAASSYTDGFNSSVGTSFSAPLVAGTAALMLSIQPTLTPDEIKNVLQSTARAFPVSGADAAIQSCRAPDSSEQLECYCTSTTCGAGMLDAAAAVAAIKLANAPKLVLSASLSGAGSGSVTSSPSGIACGSTCDASFSSASSVTLNATPAAGGIFAGWSGACSGTSTCVVSMDTAQSVTATFLPASVNFTAGWNLVGNSVEVPLAVSGSFADPALVTSIWKWVDAGTTPGIVYPTWAFYSPEQSDGGRSYAAGKGYDFLTAINAGEGFWLNAKSAFTAPLPTGTAVTSASFHGMSTGWHLISIGNIKTPGGFNADLGASPPAAGVIAQNLKTLWAWDSAQSKWYFYAPSFEAQGGTALTDFIANRGYLDFTASQKTLGPGLGFWVNMP